MRKHRIYALIALMLCLPLTMLAKVEHLLPRPQQVTVTENVAAFALSGNVTINYAEGVGQCALLEEFFTGNGCTLAESGKAVNVSLVESIEGAHDYELHGYENEAYTLDITADEINITAVTGTGIIRAAQTLTQMAEGWDGQAALEAVTIKDWPAFKLRGYMHDVGRSFISIDELVKQVEKFSRFKVNTFHWHLTENQAWRFEVKAYPELTADASMTRFPGQYYTQEDCKRLMAAAKKHGVIVIPEIDMPGHSGAFERAMGFNMQSEEGKTVLKKVLDEVCEVFADAPYIHIGGDEVSTTADYLNEMISYVESKGKGMKGGLWNPINGIGQENLNNTLAQMWGTRGWLATGKANIDCRYNYTNHFDVFADLVGIYKSTIYYSQQGSTEVAGAISGCWNDRKVADEKAIMAQNNVWANVIATAERAWMGGGKQYIDNATNTPADYKKNPYGGGVMLPNSGDEYEEFKSWEERFLFHKAHSLKGEPIPYVKQTNVRWRITDAFPNGGDKTAAFAPETFGTTTSTELIPETFNHEGNTYYTGMATGAGIYLSHTWGNSIINAYYSNPQFNHTAYAWTYVYSPKAQTVGAQIEFQNYSRSEQDGAAPAGKWDHFDSKIWLNGEEIAAPTWDNTGVSISSKEVELKNENFPGRKPVEVELKEGWNKVFLKLPYMNTGYRLKKWMFTFVLTDLEGVNAVEGLIYSPNQCLDEATELVAAKVSEIKRDRGNLIGTAVGLWPESAAATLDAKVAEIEATYSQSKTEAEREAQVTELETAWEAFEASLTAETINQPISGNYYRMYTPLRGNRYVTGNGVDAAITGNTDAATKASVWQFVSRGDNSYDIINLADGTYITTSGDPLKSVKERPTAGWTIKKAENTGNVIVVSGSSQFNQQNHTNYHLLNWGSGTNTTDDGCEYRFVDVTAIAPAIPIKQLAGYEEFENGGVYNLVTERGWMGATESSSNAISTARTTVTPAATADNPYFQWTVYKSKNGSYYLYNIGKEKFLGVQSSNNASVPLVDAPVAKTLTFKNSSSTAYPIMFSTDNSGVVNHSGNHGEGLITWTGGWDKLDDTGSNHKATLICKLEDEALAKIADIVEAYDVYEGDDEYIVNATTGTLSGSGSSSYKSSWAYTVTATYPAALTLSCGANNINTNDGLLQLHSGQAGSSEYTLAVPEGYLITGYSFDYAFGNSGTNDKKFVIGSQEYPVTASAQTLTVEDINATSTTFTLSGNNQPVKLSNFVVRIAAVEEESKLPKVGHYYRIGYDYGGNVGIKYLQSTNSSVKGLEMTEGKGESSIFYVEQDGDKLRLKSYSTGKYLKETGNTRGLHDAGGDVTFTEGSSEGKVKIQAPAYLHANSSGSNYFVDHCSGDGCAQHNFFVEEVTLVSLTVDGPGKTGATATWNGATKALPATWAIFEGVEITESTLSIACNGTYTFDGLYEGETSLGKTVEITSVEEDRTLTTRFSPAFFSTAYGEKWVDITRATNAAHAAILTSGDVDAIPIFNTIDYADEGILWCFVGTAESFKIYNKVSGEALALTPSATPADGVAVKMVATADAESWHLIEYDNGYAIAPVGNTSFGINSYTGAAGSQLKFYGVADNGTHWNFNLMDITKPLSLSVAVDKVWESSPRVAEMTLTINGASSATRILGNVENKKMYLPAGATFSLSSMTYRGYTFNGFGGEDSYTDATLPEGGLNITASYTANEERTLFYSPRDGHPYRIPAIATAPNGDIFAICDYRPCGNDIGYGEVDLVCRVSSDNGVTWTEERTIADGLGHINDGIWKMGYGDPAIVADRESNKVLVMSVCGNRTCWDGNYGEGGENENPNRISRLYITYDEEKQEWVYGEPEEVTYDIYPKFVDKDGNVHAASLFIGAGKICQSRVVKKGDYYRLYCAVWNVTKTQRQHHNYVIYSDDFGKTWDVLGELGYDNCPSKWGNEPKCEELPDGTVVLSSRKYGGRYFNLFTFDDDTYTTGSWLGEVGSNEVQDGLSFGGNSTNGEIYKVKAVHKESGRICDLMFQSIPTGSERTDVAIYYKEMEYDTDGTNKYTATTFAQGWTKGIHVSTKGSCYSTMISQADGRIAFFFEEEPSGYCMVYIPYTIEDLTADQYTLYTVESSIGQYGIGTFYASEAMAIPEGVKAYVATENPVMENETGVITMTELTGIIPANTGAVIRGEADTYEFIPSISYGTPVADNMMEGYEAADNNPDSYNEVVLDNSYTTYVLAVENEKAGFYRKEAGFKVYNNKAYLNVPTTAGVRSLAIRFDGDGTTGIENSELSIFNSQFSIFYDLMGRRVVNPVKGVYIVNGKKVIVK